MMTNNNFHEFPRKPRKRPVNFDAFGKICKCCNGRFHPDNRMQIFCCDYCKNVWHYENDKKEHQNDKLLEDGDYNNYKALKALDELGMLDVSERDLMVREFNPLLTPRYVLVDGRMTACYNNYGIYAVDETMFKIIKISSWEKLDK